MPCPDDVNVAATSERPIEKKKKICQYIDNYITKKKYLDIDRLMTSLFESR